MSPEFEINDNEETLRWHSQNNERQLRRILLKNHNIGV